MELQDLLEHRRRDFHRLLLATFPFFVDGWIYHDISARLRKFMLDVRAGKSPRLILCMPPRMGKSEVGSVRFPIYCLLNNPMWEIIVTSYSQNLVNRFSRFARSLVQSHPYIRSLWPDVFLSSDHAAVEEWQLTTGSKQLFSMGGTYKAVGKGGSITGAGANCLLIDDTLKDFEEADSPNARAALWDWYTTVARTRLAPGGGILIIQTRWHPDDLVGMVLHAGRHIELADKWDEVVYQALAEKDEVYRKTGESILPERWTETHFRQTKAITPPRWWNALYQQRPSVPGGNLFKSHLFRRYTSLPNDFITIIQAWDLRFGKSQLKSSSFVCGLVIGKTSKGDFYILDQFRERWSYAETREAIKNSSVAWPSASTILIENKANGAAIESDLEGQVPGILLYNPRGDKIQRAERILHFNLAGRIYFPEESISDWVKEAIEEISLFPRAAHNDRVDCLSMGLGYLMEQEQQMQTVYAL